jgi:hypothetical protein
MQDALASVDLSRVQEQAVERDRSRVEEQERQVLEQEHSAMRSLVGRVVAQVRKQNQVRVRVVTASRRSAAVEVPYGEGGLEDNGVRQKLRVWLKDLQVSSCPGVEEMVYVGLADALARTSPLFSGMGDEVLVAPVVGAYEAIMAEYEAGEPLPDAVARQLDEVMPAFVSALESEFLQWRGEASDFVPWVLRERMPRVSEVMEKFVASGLSGFDPGVLPAAEAVTGLTMEESAGLLGNLMREVGSDLNLTPDELALLSRVSGYETPFGRGLGFGSGGRGFDQYPELGDGELDNGLREPRKLTLPAGAVYFNPVALFREPYSVPVDGGGVRNASLLEVFYGMPPRVAGLLRRLALGEARLVDVDLGQVSQMFESGVKQGRSLTPVFDLLAKGIRVVPEGSRAGSVAHDLLELYFPGSATGPDALASVLNALGCNDPLTSRKLFVHQQVMQVGGDRSSRDFGVLTCTDRKLLLEGMTVPLSERLQSSIVPMVRVPAPVGVKGDDAVQDGTHRVLLLLRQRVAELGSVHGAGDRSRMLARIQVLMGYYLLGAGAYDSMRLPYARLEPVPLKTMPGVLPSLEGKMGMFRLFRQGFRVPYSGRLIAKADLNLPANTIGLPAVVMATLRGHLAAKHLRDAHAGGGDLRERVRAGFLAAVFDGYSANCPSANLVSELRSRVEAFEASLGREYGEGAFAVFASVQEEFYGMLGVGRDVFASVCGRGGSGGGYAVMDFLSEFAGVCLGDRMVAPWLEQVNNDWRMVVSRYPRLHAQSFLSVKTMVNPAGDNTLRVNPLIATPLNLDFDGDQIEVMAHRRLNPMFQPLLDRYSVDKAVFDSGSPFSLAFDLTLNALEGIYKANMFFAQGMEADRLPEAAVSGRLAELPSREELLRRLETDPNALAGVHEKLMSGFGGLEEVESGQGRTRVSRYFFHAVMSRVLGAEAVGRIFGPVWVPVGTRARTDRTALRAAVLEAGAADGMLLPLLAGVSNYGARLAVLEAGSGMEYGQGIDEQLDYVRNDRNVSLLRAYFRSRVLACEQAYAAGFLTHAELTAVLLGLEAGDRDSGWEVEFEKLRSEYLGPNVMAHEAPEVGQGSLGKGYLEPWAEEMLDVSTLDEELKFEDLGEVRTEGDLRAWFESRDSAMDEFLNRLVGVEGEGTASVDRYVMHRIASRLFGVEETEKVFGPLLVPYGGKAPAVSYADVRSAFGGKGAAGKAFCAFYDVIGPELALARCSEFLRGTLREGRAGLKPLLMAMVRLATDRYEVETGSPHVWAEQVLAGRLKARDDIVMQTCVGALHVVQGGVLPSSYDDLMAPEMSVDGIAVMSQPALWRSVLSKTEVPVGGEFLKDLLAITGSVTVGRSSEALGYVQHLFPSMEDETVRRDDMLLLARRCCGRVVRVPGAPAEFNERLGILVRSVPYDASSVAGLLEEARRYSGHLEMVSPLVDPGFPGSVAPEAIGVDPMEGVEVVDAGGTGVAVRSLLSSGRHVGYPIGSVASGALGEEVTQSALRMRHVAAVGSNGYSGISGYWRMKYGPFPSRSPFFREGAERLRGELPASTRFGLYASVFSARVKAESCPVRRVTVPVVIDGIQLYPGEVYEVSGGRLTVGTDRPVRMHWPVVENAESLPGTKAVRPSMYVVTCAGLDGPKEPTMESHVVGGKQVNWFWFGGVGRAAVPAEVYDEFMDGLKGGSPIVAPMEGCAWLEPDAGGTGPVFHRVVDSVAFSAANGSFVPEGAVFGSVEIPAFADKKSLSGLAVLSTNEIVQEMPRGFMVSLDFLKVRPLSPSPAVLSPVDGTVLEIRPQSRFGGMAAFDVVIQPKGEGALPVSVRCDLPEGWFPTVYAGQRLDAGDPLTLGHVNLEERAVLRPGFRQELADWLFATFDGVWSAHLDLVARSLVSEGADGKDQYLSFGKAYRWSDSTHLYRGTELNRHGLMGGFLRARELGLANLDASRVSRQGVEPDKEYPSVTVERKLGAPAHPGRKIVDELLQCL